MILPKTLAATILLCTFFSKAEAALYFEPEIGLFTGEYKSAAISTITGLQTGLSTGYQEARFQAGVEINCKTFQTEMAGESLSYTNFPIGLAFRLNLSENWRLLTAWYWDDVLYKDFRFKFQQGFKLPKDYDVAYEGPGSLKLGLSHKLSSNIFMNHVVFPQNFKTYKRRRPTEMIGDVTPQIHIFSYSVTVSVLL